MFSPLSPPMLPLQVASTVAYFIYHFHFFLRTRGDLKTRPYSEVRLARILFAVQVRLHDA